LFPGVRPNATARMIVKRDIGVKSNKKGDASSSGGSTDGISSATDPVGQRLRDFFSAIEDEGIPDRFLDLLDKLDAAESASGESPGTSTGRGGKDGI
jgi:Anti-sigma factor NepR